MPDYPKALPMHTTQVWQHDLCFTNKSYDLIRSYYHVNDFPINMHSHKFYEINIITKGTGRHYLESQSFDIGVGYVFIIPPNISHGYWSSGDMEVFHILVSSVFFERYAEELRVLDGYTMLFDIEPHLRNGCDIEFFLKLSAEQQRYLKPQLDSLAAYQDAAYAGINTLKTALAMHVIGYLSMQMAINHKNLRNTAISHSTLDIISTMEFINRNLSEKLTVDGLAELANMSRSTYLRKFQEICKCSPAQYINNCRLKQAATLLVTTSMPIIDIALECGYFDSSHFIRFFTRKFCVNPVEYRKRNSGGL